MESDYANPHRPSGRHRIGHSLCHAAAALIAPALAGRDCLARPQALAEFDRLLSGELSAQYLRAAFEMALLGLAGKHYGECASAYRWRGVFTRSHPTRWLPTPKQESAPAFTRSS